jgi:EmrB/QacA subfamily drug resistance transporter
MTPPCDKAVVYSKKAGFPCSASDAPWILAATILGSSMAFIDSTVVNVALPALQTNLHATVVGVQWVVEAYGLFLGALILVGGSLGDMVGRRRMFLAGVAIFALASIACGFAGDIQQLVIARSVQGIGAAFLVPGSLSIIGASFDEKSRGQAIGTWSGFTAITTAAGPVLGGWLIEHASWRWAFFINVPLAAAVVAISLRRIPESRNPGAGAVDWKGALLAVVGLGGVVYGLIESVGSRWGRPEVLGSFCAGCVCLILFVWAEAKESSPMVPLALFQSPSFSGANLLTLFLYSALGIFFFLFPLDLIQVQGFSPTATGAAALPFILLVFALSRWSGGLVARYGSRTPLIVGPCIVAGGFALFDVPGVGANYWKSFFPAFVVLGLGMAVSVAPLTTIVMDSVGRDRAGTASGINNAVARVAGLLSVAVLGIVMVKVFSHSLEQTLAGVPLPPGVLQYVRANEIKLAGMDLPAGLDAQTGALVRSAISRAFVRGFRVVNLICVGLAVASALVAGWMIPARRE